MSGKRNKAAGHKFERDCARILREVVGYTDVKTSRECSRLRDAKKVDLCNADEDENGRLPFNFQCKSYSAVLNYKLLFSELEEHNKQRQVNTILHRYTEKRGKIFMEFGQWAILKGEQFDLFAQSESCMKYVNLLRTSVVTHTKKHKFNYVNHFKQEIGTELLFVRNEEYNVLFMPIDVFWKLLTLYKNGEEEANGS